MLRLVLVVLGLGAVWLGYDWVMAPDARAEGETHAAGPDGAAPAEGVALDADAGVGAELAAVGGGANPARTSENRTSGNGTSGDGQRGRSSGAALAASGPAAGAAPDPLQRLIDGLRSAKPEKAAATAFRVLNRTRGRDRERLAAALQEAADAASPLGLVALLGRSNSFLASPEGKQMARRAIELSAEQTPEAAATMLTKVLEACMRGKIAKGDTAARTLVAEAYRALQGPLRRTVLNPAYVARARTHTVQSGESLDRIARKFRRMGLRVNAGTIAVFNRISDPRLLQVGQKLKIPVDPVRTVVEKNSYLQAVYVGDVMFRLYWVGHGKDDCTPETTFTIGAKQERPDWYAPGGVVPYGHPDNVLGDYFVKFKHASFSGFGVHGTNQPDSIGTQSSAGCIRMTDADIEDYFKLVPRGTEFEIRASR